MEAPESINVKTFDDWFILSDGHIEIRRYGHEDVSVDVVDICGLGIVYGATAGQARHLVLELQEDEMILHNLDHHAEDFRDLILKHKAAYGPDGSLAGEHNPSEEELTEARHELDPYQR